MKDAKLKVIVRIKPFGAGGGGVESEALNKETKSCVKFKTKNNKNIISVKNKTYTFPHLIIPPNYNQKSTYETIIDDLIYKFLNGRDVNILAFGQTGGGKTHTLFGPPFFLKKCYENNDYNNKDIGFFPRAALDILDKIETLKSKNNENLILTGTMVEIHYGEYFDILNNKSPIEFDRFKSRIIGETEWILNSKKQIMKFSSMSETRTTRGTLLNDTSSRTHCFTCLKLKKQINKDKYIETKFQFVDFAGYENIVDAHGDINKAKKTESGMEGIVINYGLISLVYAFESFSKFQNIHKKTKSYQRKKINSLTSVSTGPVISGLLFGTFVGETETRMFLNISQAPKNSEKGIFALKFGENAAKMKVGSVKKKPFSFKKVFEICNTNIKINKDALEKLKNTKNEKYKLKRQSQITKYSNQIKILKELLKNSK